MLRTALLAASCLLVSIESAHADPCGKAEQATFAVLKAFDAAAQGAVVIGHRCMFHGRDARAVKKLEVSVRRAMKQHDTMRDPADACIQAGTFPDAMNVHGQAFGLRVGLAWTLCSPDLPGLIADLRASQTPDDQIKAKVNELSQAWIRSLAE